MEFYNLYITPKEYSFRFIFYRKSLPHLNGVYINGTSNLIRAPLWLQKRLINENNFESKLSS